MKNPRQNPRAVLATATPKELVVHSRTQREANLCQADIDGDGVGDACDAN